MSADIRSILQRLTTIEGKLSPVSTRHGLTQQQQSVPQLPALLKAKKISVLGAPRDPKHPFQGYAVGANEGAEPRNALEEAMQEVEEDMLSRVKQDLNTYLDRLDKKHHDDGRRDKDTPALDRLTKKEKIDRDLIQKAVDAIERRQAEEQVAEAESDYELSDPSTVHDIEDQVDTALGQPQQPVANMESAPIKTYTLEDGNQIECWGNEKDGFELRRGSRSLGNRFDKLDHADMAVKLWQRKQTKPNLSAPDYVEER